MPFQHRCPFCEAVLTLPDDAVGKPATCEKCEASFTVPRRARDEAQQQAAADPKAAKKQRGDRLVVGAVIAGLVVMLAAFGTLGLYAAGLFDGEKKPDETAAAKPDEPKPPPDEAKEEEAPKPRPGWWRPKQWPEWPMWEPDPKDDPKPEEPDLPKRDAPKKDAPKRDDPPRLGPGDIVPPAMPDFPMPFNPNFPGRGGAGGRGRPNMPGMPGNPGFNPFDRPGFPQPGFPPNFPNPGAFGNPPGFPPPAGAPREAPGNPPAAADRPRAGGNPVRAADEPFPITPTKAADRAEVKLPAPADAACWAGGGRFVVFRLPRVRQAAVLDLSEGKVAKYLPLPEEGCLVAAGMEHVFVLAPAANVIQRWSLKTFEKEATIVNPVGGTPRQIVMGHAAASPLLVAGPGVGRGGFAFLDPKTMRDFDVPPAVNGPGMHAGVGNFPQVRVSADGRVYAWAGPFGYQSLVFGAGGEVKEFREGNGQGPLVPGPDGTIFTSSGLLSPELKPVGERKPGFGSVLVPAAHGNYYLDLFTGNAFDGGNPPRTRVSVKMLGDNRPLVDIGVPDGLDLKADPFGGRGAGLGTLSLAERVFVSPDAKAMAVLNGTFDKVVLHAFDIDQLLDRSGIDYLLVTGRPPAAVRGTTFTYTPAVKSKKGGVKVTVDAGPDRMKAAGGTVTWAIPENFADGSVSVILTVSDASGQEVFHTFTLAVTDKPR